MMTLIQIHPQILSTHLPKPTLPNCLHNQLKSPYNQPLCHKQQRPQLLLQVVWYQQVEVPDPLFHQVVEAVEAVEEVEVEVEEYLPHQEVEVEVEAVEVEAEVVEVEVVEVPLEDPHMSMKDLKEIHLSNSQE